MTRHGHASERTRSQMIQRSTIYPIKMAAAIICQAALLIMIVWGFH